MRTYSSTPLPPSAQGHSPNFWPVSIVAKRSPISATAKLLYKRSPKSYLIELELETLLVYYFRVIDSVSEWSPAVKEQNKIV